jgi:hypothetical protein
MTQASFNELSNEAKLLFVILITDQKTEYLQIVNAYYDAGAPKGSYREAETNVIEFIQECRRASTEEQKRRRAAQRKIKALIRV